jgi:hypothetical protein
MNAAVKRLILRWTRLVPGIPVLGYIHGRPSEVQQYATAVRFVFVPVMILSGLWMYAGLLFAVAGVALWLAVYLLSGSGAAVLGQFALFIARRTWLAIQARRSGPRSPAFGKAA